MGPAVEQKPKTVSATLDGVAETTLSAVLSQPLSAASVAVSAGFFGEGVAGAAHGL